MTAFTILTLLCITFCFTFSTQDKIIVHINAQHIQKMRQEAVICEKETGVPAATLKKIIDWPLNNDEATKKFFHCVCFNCQYTDKDGHMIVENMAKLTIKNGTQEDYLDRVRECNKITLDNYLETIFAVGGCAHDKILFVID